MELRKWIYVANNGRCERCGKRMAINEMQLAHRIAKGKSTGRRWIQNRLEELGLPAKKKNVDAIIHHELNFACSCADCNDYFNIYNKPEQARELFNKILKDLELI